MRPFPARAFPDAGSYRCGVLPAARRFAPALTAVNADADLPAHAAQPAAGSAYARNVEKEMAAKVGKLPEKVTFAAV